MYGDSQNIAARIAAYLAKLPHLAEGEGRDNKAYQFAAYLVRDMSQPDDQALRWLDIWDQHNSPPVGRERLTEIINNARKYGTRPDGAGLNRPGSRQREKTETGQTKVLLDSNTFLFANFREEARTSEDGKITTNKVGLSVATLGDELRRRTGGWPKRVGSTLFVEGANHQPVFLDSTDALFAWMGECLNPDRENTNRCIEKESFGPNAA